VTYGLPRLLEELRNIGVVAEEHAAPDGTKFALMSPFTVQAGRFAERTIDLAVQATPDFPMTVASAIHVRANPQLYVIGDNGNGTRNITNSILGPEWAYWSHNFGWGNGERSARRLLSQINGIFLRAA
jgi:hypothetical protein